MHTPAVPLGFVRFNVGLLARSAVAYMRRCCGVRTRVLYMIFLSPQKMFELLTQFLICRTAPLTSRRYILNISSTNIRTEYFKHAA
jgi:hypothetical protein